MSNADTLLLAHMTNCMLWLIIGHILIMHPTELSTTAASGIQGQQHGLLGTLPVMYHNLACIAQAAVGIS